ncbi:MAG: hypothetical protein UHZ01_03815 [Prevotella sp.]|nr:hypothetical protein [Prevotella sp.]
MNTLNEKLVKPEVVVEKVVEQAVELQQCVNFLEKLDAGLGVDNEEMAADKLLAILKESKEEEMV